jgi:peptide chain release factor subunit 3
VSLSAAPKPVSLSAATNPPKPVSLSAAPKPVSLSAAADPPKPVSLSAAPKPVSLSAAADPPKPVSLSAAPKPVSLSAAADPPKPVSLSAAPAPVAKAPEPEPEEDEDDDEIDETDPLWIATLKMAGGDREKCIKLLEDPDSLMSDPEIQKLMDSMETTDEDWETAASVAEAAASSSSSSSSSGDAGDAAPAKAVPVAPKAPGKKAVPVAEVEDADDGEVTDGDPREHVNLVFIGHVDAGKSTLSGSILYLMGMVDKRTIERFEKEAKTRNRESWFLAFIMDTSEEERQKGITVEVGRAQFCTEKNRYTILDAPGHKNYVPNMIAGAAQADVGVLVISARKGEFETGFEKGGQTREHALLAKTLGVRTLVVVINKMDDPTVEWAQERYEECVGKLKPYLKSCGFTIKTEVKFLPIAGLTGQNILEEVSPSVCPWWRPMYTSGGHNTSTPTVMSTFDNLVIPGRNADAALRIPVLDRYFERGTIVMGKVESGTIRVGDEVVVAPTKKKSKVEALWIDETKVRSARPGENVLVKFNLNVEDFQKGFVLCAGSVCRSTLEFKVQLALIDLLEHRPIFSMGYDCVMHAHTTEVEVTVKELNYVIDEKTGKNIKRPFARQGQQVVCRLVVPLSTCLETFDDFPALGRVTLRDEGRTIAIGKIIQICKSL